MASGWAPEGAVQDQIDASIKEAVELAQSRLPKGNSLTHCEVCDSRIPEARRIAIPGVQLCVNCQAKQEVNERSSQGINRRASKDSQLR